MSDLKGVMSRIGFTRVDDDGRDGDRLDLRSLTANMSPRLVLAAAAVVTLGVWADYHFGSDLRQSIKMERM
jgi:hypothetical protein